MDAGELETPAVGSSDHDQHQREHCAKLNGLQVQQAVKLLSNLQAQVP